ncbi:MAG: chorismate lyase [Tepidimonas taiwanensis]|nr:chorismate lyase [Tepidimonas taiwanensis]
MNLHSGMTPVPVPSARFSSRPPLAWLRAPGSLTRHLVRVCPGSLVVEVLGEGWAKADPASARLLGLWGGARVWRREVCLACRHAGTWTPYVHAITLGSPAAQRRLGLARLGQRPLGLLLFRGGARRLELAILPPGRSGPQWARRSLFLLRGQHLVVWEAFLPGLPPFRR